MNFNIRPWLAAILAGAAIAAAVAVAAIAPAAADDAKPAIPQFQVDALWPKALPNNWIIGQVAGIAVDRVRSHLGCSPAELAHAARTRRGA